VGIPCRRLNGDRFGITSILGRTLVKDAELVAEWKRTARALGFVEMEAGGVYRAARGPKGEYPVLIVRGLSDIVGFKRAAEWTEYACRTAAAFATAFIRAGVVRAESVSVPESIYGDGDQPKQSEKRSSPARVSIGSKRRNIKILFLAANPAGTTKLALDEELRAIDAKIRGAEYGHRFTLRSHWAVRLEELSGFLMRYRPHIIHFSGHGAATGRIVLAGADGTPKTVPPETLPGMFNVLKDNLRVVVLNACYSADQAKAITTEIDCAIGMSDAIHDGAGRAFTAEFYQAIGFGKSVEHAFQLGMIRLVGEGVTNAKRLVILHKRRGVNPNGIVFVEGDIGSGGKDTVSVLPDRLEDVVTQASNVYEVEAKIRGILRPLMGSVDGRAARLDRAFARWPGLLDQIKIEGEAGVFLDLLLRTMREYGDVEPGVPAARVLLESVRGEVGAANRASIDELVNRLGGSAGKAHPGSR
jgi:hypothetical protein